MTGRAGAVRRAGPLDDRRDVVAHTGRKNRSRLAAGAATGGLSGRSSPTGMLATMRTFRLTGRRRFS